MPTNEYGTYKRKVLCVNKNTEPSTIMNNVTVGLWYDVLGEDDNVIVIWDDISVNIYDKENNNFISKQEYRKLKLQKINDRG